MSDQPKKRKAPAPEVIVLRNVRGRVRGERIPPPPPARQAGIEVRDAPQVTRPEK